MQFVLVTGAYGGMGRATTEALVKAGFCVFALDKKVGEAIEGVIPLQVDVTSEESIARALESVRAVTDELCAIVHFAGVYALDSLVEMQSEAFERVFQINLFGVFYINKAFLPLLKTGGKILITTSELAPLDPLPFTGVYAVAKGALDKYAYSLRMELQLLGVSVSVLRAGAVETDMLGVSTTALDIFCEKTKLYDCNATRFRDIVNRVEARRIPPEKIARKAMKILQKRKPKFAHTINRNPLLLLLNILPSRFQFWIIGKILKK